MLFLSGSQNKTRKQYINVEYLNSKIYKRLEKALITVYETRKKLFKSLRFTHGFRHQKIKPCHRVRNSSVAQNSFPNLQYAYGMRVLKSGRRHLRKEKATEVRRLLKTSLTLNIFSSVKLQNLVQWDQ